jgi:hypothetical protein
VIDSAHEKFSKRVTDSVSAVFVVAEFLHRKGYTIEIPRLRIRQKWENPSDYADGGDLFVLHENGERSRIEVKGINTQFTGRDDFPHKSMIVSSKKRIDEIGPTVARWIILSKDKTHYGSISWDTHEKWEARELSASNTNKNEWFYLAPLDVVKYGSILI